MTRYLVVLAIVGMAVPAMAGPGDTLVGNPFILGYNGWNEVPQAIETGGALPANWGISLRTGGLQESSDNRISGGGTNNQLVKSLMMVNDFAAQGEYTLSSTVRVYDNDGGGLMFGYQDVNNWYRVTWRQQAGGGTGYPTGLSVQQCVGGTITSLGLNASWTPTISHMGGQTSTEPITPIAPVDAPFNISVKVTSAGWGVYVEGANNGDPLVSGTDVPAGKIGVHSWYQRQNGTSYNPAYPSWGNDWNSVTVKDAGGTPVFQDTFNTTSPTAVSPVAWRSLQMVKQGGATWLKQGDDYGNFHLDFRDGTIVDDSNGYEWATTTTGSTTRNIDFVGPAIVVDSPGSANYGDIEMKVRLSTGDNDGIGVLVRVQDDDSFYRVNFCNEAMGTNGQRAPQGLSIQKCDDGNWTELFRDDQEDPEFVYTPGQPFDLKVTVVGNGLRVQVIKDPNGTPETIDYGWIYDSSDPLLTGTVGLAQWGNGNAGNGCVWGAYGGVAGTPLVIEIPEPATMCLLAVFGGVTMLARRRRLPA